MNVSSNMQTQVFQSSSNSSSRSSSLSTEQKATIEDVLSKFDADSLSESDAIEIKEAFAEAGIEPSQAMAKAMESAGFDAKEVGDLAAESGGSAVEGKGGRPMGPPPPPPEEEVDSLTELLESLISSDEDESTTTDLSVSSESFDTILDYTSKIMSLKDDAKTEVTELLEKYNSDENQLSQEDTQKFIVNSLSQILNESDNYNRISFYA